MPSFHDVIEAWRDDPNGVRSVAELDWAPQPAWHFKEVGVPLMQAVANALARKGWDFGQPVLGESVGVELRGHSLRIAVSPDGVLTVECTDHETPLRGDSGTRELLRLLDEALRGCGAVAGLRWWSRQEWRVEESRRG